MKKFFLIGIIATILIAVPLTVYIITNGGVTKPKTSAATTTLLAFTIPSQPAVVGTPVAIPITVDPTGGNSANTPNQISFIKLTLTYDGTKLSAPSNYFVVQSPFTTLVSPTNTCDPKTNICTITTTVTTGVNPASAVSSLATVATLNFNPLVPTDTNNPTPLTFVANQNQVLSIASTDKPAENVLQSAQSGSLVIVAAATTDTPTPTLPPGTTPTDTPTPGSGGSGGGGGGGGTTAPISCTSLTANTTNGAAAPLTVLFTATGGSTAGNVTKVSFNYGDGSVQDITTGGGIGTNNASVQASHIYNTTGTFTATAVFTDDAGNVTTPSACSQTITIGSAAAATPTPTTAAIAATTPTPTIPATGPGDVFLGVGAVGAIITVLGLVVAFGV